MKRTTWFFALAMAGIVFFSGWNDAQAGRRVHIKSAPPAVKVVVRPASPYIGGIWMGGHWAWREGKYVWTDGRWMKPRNGHLWIDGRWRHTPYGWKWIPGRWKRC